MYTHRLVTKQGRLRTPHGGAIAFTVTSYLVNVVSRRSDSLGDGQVIFIACYRWNYYHLLHYVSTVGLFFWNVLVLRSPSQREVWMWIIMTYDGSRSASFYFYQLRNVGDERIEPLWWLSSRLCCCRSPRPLLQCLSDSSFTFGFGGCKKTWVFPRLLHLSCVRVILYRRTGCKV